jgi:hypothetical protein
MLRLIAAATGMLALVGLTACQDIPELGDLEQEIESQLPAATFHLEEHVRLGPFTMWLARGIVGIAANSDHDADTRQAAAIVRSIREVEVATYRVTSHGPLAMPPLSAELSHRLGAHGWTSVVRTSQHDEQTVVMTHAGSSPGAIDAMLVVALEPRELTIVRLGGRLDQVLAAALAENPRGVIGTGHHHHAPADEPSDGT